MILSVHANYPQTRTYVLKLHRDSDPTKGILVGRIEHVASSLSIQFNSTAELIACLTSSDFAALGSAQ